MSEHTVRSRAQSVGDRATAALLRETYLEPALEDTDPIVCNLNGIEQLSVDAADELVGKFVVRLRSQRPGAVVFVQSIADDVLAKVHAALRDRHQAAWGVNQRKPEAWLVLGDLAEPELEALRAFAPGVPESALLDALASKGLLVKNGNSYAAPALAPEPEAVPA